MKTIIETFHVRLRRVTLWRISFAGLLNWWLLTVIGWGTAHGQLLTSQDLLSNEPPQLSGVVLDVVPFAQLADRQVLSTSSPAHDRRLYSSSSGGVISVIDPLDDHTNQPFRATSSVWFDVSTQLDLNLDNRAHGGLRSFAFHPDFESNGKFYVSALVDRPSVTTGLNYLGTSQPGPGIRADSALVEFTYDHAENKVGADSARELFRIAMPVYDHPIKQISFDPFAKVGDENYGLLFVNHGDSSAQPARDGGGLNMDDGLGKVLRIDPLAAETLPYSIPSSNPFADSNDGALPEIFALGFRNPHNLSFAERTDGTTQLVVADIGRSHVEEINLVDRGQNYGWSTREGPLVHLQAIDGSFGNGIAPLPSDEANENSGQGFVYPATMFDHRLVNASLAITGSHVIQNGSSLSGQYVFGEFGSTGMLLHASFDELQAATTSLDSSDSDRDEPSELTYANPALLSISFDHDNNPNTPRQEHDTTTSMLDRNRSELRFGRGHLGELYLTSKATGVIYLVENSLPLPGDADFDGKVQFSDFLALSRNFDQPGDWWEGDFDGSGMVEFADFLLLSRNFGQSSTSTASVPETSEGSLLAMLGVLLLLRRERR